MYKSCMSNNTRPEHCSRATESSHTKSATNFTVWPSESSLEWHMGKSIMMERKGAASDSESCYIAEAGAHQINAAPR